MAAQVSGEHHPACASATDITSHMSREIPESKFILSEKMLGAIG